MATELFVLTLLKAELASSGAILLVLLLRLPARRLIGAELAYGLWAAAPAGALASLFPGLPEFVAPVDAVAGRILRPGSFFDGAPALAHAVLLARLWLAGAAGMALLYALAEARFRRQIHAGQACGDRRLAEDDRARRLRRTLHARRAGAHPGARTRPYGSA
jgi:beta-lactamase regulating signal transducer with metallopeptidase domain